MIARISLCALLFLLIAPFAFADHAVSINSADKAALTTLTGIGEVKAQAIIDYRNANGPFANIEDVMNVSGIGPATFNSIKDHITIAVTSGQPSVEPSKEEEKTGSETTPPPSSSAAISSYVPPPSPSLFVDAGSDRTAIVGADSEFWARAYNKGSEIVENVRFSWNFGDGSTEEGQTVHHHFDYPGRYAVVVTIAENKNAASDRIIVTAIPADLSFTVLPDSGVAIENRARSDIDISRWIVKSFGRSFILPEHSVVLAGETLRISRKTLAFETGPQTELQYPNGTTAFRAGEYMPGPVPETGTELTETAPATPTAIANSADELQQIEETIIPETGEEEAAVVEGSVEEILATSSQTASVGATVSGSWKWWAGAVMLAAVGAGAMFFARRYAKREWSIVEDTSE